MFLTPGIRSANYRINENSDNLLQAKKSSGGLAPTRKPLGDKAVNERSPSKRIEKTKKASKELHAIKGKTAVSPKISPKFHDNELLADICSYEDGEDYMEDILPYTERLGVSGIVNILNSYARCSTPTPEIVYIEAPSLCFDRFDVLLHDDNISLHEESVGDVSLPSLDFDACSF